MTIRRVVPDIQSDTLDDARQFYGGFLGFDLAMDMGWIVTFASPSNPTAQISVISRDVAAEINPDISIEVEDVDTVHAEALRRGIEIVYPITDEPWGVRRFFASDPSGTIINIVSHRS